MENFTVTISTPSIKGNMRTINFNFAKQLTCEVEGFPGVCSFEQVRHSFSGLKQILEKEVNRIFAGKTLEIKKVATNWGPKAVVTIDGKQIPDGLTDFMGYDFVKKGQYTIGEKLTPIEETTRTDRDQDNDAIFGENNW